MENQELIPVSQEKVEEKLKKYEGLSDQQAVDQFNKDYDPALAPSSLFGLYAPHFFSLVDGLSNKQLRRLVKALVVYPLEPIKPNKNNDAEVKAYNIGDRMLQAKYLMILYTAHEAQEKQKAEAEARRIAAEAVAQEEQVSVPEQNNNEVNTNG